MSNIPDIFSSFQEYLDNEQAIREDIRSQVREIETLAREILITLQCIHQENGIKEVPAACEKAHLRFNDVKAKYESLKKVVPEGQYYRFHDHWRFATQRLSFLVALVEYLESGKLSTRDEVAAVLGLECQRTEGFHLDLEDYLVGLLQLASELSRFTVNSVTSGDYSRPLQVSKFMAELSAGFRLLNLKNDSLRKRFDGLKYDIKKVEEVVYDLSIRGLKPAEAEETAGGLCASAPKPEVQDGSENSATIT